MSWGWSRAGRKPQNPHQQPPLPPQGHSGGATVSLSQVHVRLTTLQQRSRLPGRPAKLSRGRQASLPAMGLAGEMLWQVSASWTEGQATGLRGMARATRLALSSACRGSQPSPPPHSRPLSWPGLVCCGYREGPHTWQVLGSAAPSARRTVPEPLTMAHCSGHGLGSRAGRHRRASPFPVSSSFRDRRPQG